MPVPWSPVPSTRPGGKGKVGDALEAGIERFRDHLRRPYRPDRNQLTDAMISYTEDQTLPMTLLYSAVRLDAPPAHWLEICGDDERLHDLTVTDQLHSLLTAR